MTREKNCINKIFYGVVFCLFLLNSCAYSFRAGHFEGTVSISSLENETANAEIARVIKDKLEESFVEDGRVDISSDGDFFINGVIKKYERNPSSYTEEGEIEEYKLKVEADFSLTKKEEESPRWEKTIEEFVIYSASMDELEGIEEVSVRIKDDLLRYMLDSW